METNKQFPTLYAKAGNDLIHEWTIWTEGPLIKTKFGVVGGKHQTTNKKAEAKSIGRSNETTPEQQAVLEAQSMWNVKIDKGYKKSQKEAEEGTVFLPMLAKDYAKHGHKINFPASVQPKLDGLRCMAFWDGEVIRLMSRRGKDFELPHIAQELEKFLPHDLVLDGELYAHGETFQTITSWVKRYQDDTKRVELHAYDCYLRSNIKAPYKDRFETLANWYNKHKPKTVGFVDTYDVNSKDEILELQSKFAAEGYEGAIVRDHGGVYKLKHRSSELLKVKDFRDNEYKVVGWENGKGRFKDCAIWICKTENDHQFRVVSKGTMEQRQEMLSNADDYVGQWLKVKYFDLTDDGVPRFPVGIGFRLPEDM